MDLQIKNVPDEQNTNVIKNLRESIIYIDNKVAELQKISKNIKNMLNNFVSFDGFDIKKVYEVPDFSITLTEVYSSISKYIESNYENKDNFEVLTQGLYKDFLFHYPEYKHLTIRRFGKVVKQYFDKCGYNIISTTHRDKSGLNVAYYKSVKKST